MSLLADLLSKVKHEETRADIPPDLRQRVREGSKNRSKKRRFTAFLVVALVVIAAGYGAIYLTQLYIGTPIPSTKPAVKRDLPPSPQPPAATPVPAAAPATVPAAAVTPPKEVPRTPAVQQAGSPAVSAPKPIRVPAARTGRVVRPARDTSPDTAPTGPEARVSDRRVEKDAHLYAARNYEQERAYHEALGEYRKALAMDPENPVILSNLAGILVRLNRYEEAAMQAQRALVIRKDYVPALINLGLARISLGRETEGEDSLLRAREIEPTHPHVLLNLALLYERRKILDKAAPLFRGLAERGNSQGYLGLARIAEKQGRMGDAEALYREILNIDAMDMEAKKLAAERLSLILHSR